MTAREAFEAHIRKKFPTAKEELLFSRSSIGRYRSIATEDAWLAWQAASAAALERAAEVCVDISAHQLTFQQRKTAATCAEAIRALKDES